MSGLISPYDKNAPLCEKAAMSLWQWQQVLDAYSQKPAYKSQKSGWCHRVHPNHLRNWFFLIYNMPSHRLDWHRVPIQFFLPLVLWPPKAKGLCMWYLWYHMLVISDTIMKKYTLVHIWAPFTPICGYPIYPHIISDIMSTWYHRYGGALHIYPILDAKVPHCGPSVAFNSYNAHIISDDDHRWYRMIWCVTLNTAFLLAFLLTFLLAFLLAFLPLLTDRGQGPDTGNVTPITAGSRWLKHTHLAILIFLLSLLLPLPKWPSPLL